MVKKTPKFDLNSFLNVIKLKKKYLDEINSQIVWLNAVKNSIKEGDSPITSNSNLNGKPAVLVSYIIYIKFSRTNTLTHVTDFEGNMKAFYSAGSFKFSGKSKTARIPILKKFFKILKKKLRFLNNQPISLHFRNVRLNHRIWVLKILKKLFPIKLIRVFQFSPHNGCRARKVKRKKIRTRRRK